MKAGCITGRHDKTIKNGFWAKFFKKIFIQMFVLIKRLFNFAASY